MMKIVVVGKGGREHALAEKLSESPKVKELWVVPGNAGMALAGLSCVNLSTNSEIVEFCFREGVDLVVLGPEAYILSDLREHLQQKGIACFAPSKEAGRLEASKKFCKEILLKAGVRTAGSLLMTSMPDAVDFLKSHDFSSGLVLKADGLAQGKGVWVCENLTQAEEGLRQLSEQFGFPILFEECLKGKELSAFALCDGEDFVVMGTACDYKRITEDLYSANTGGMGAYSPCDFISSEEENEIREIFAKTLRCLKENNLSYQGFLFAGLMKTEKGLYVLEYNVRMGDPETQALLPRIQSDLAELIWSATQHQLAGQKIETSKDSTVHVVAASQGYPQNQMLLGQKISLGTSLSADSAQIYFAGVDRRGDELVNSGGRVLGVTAKSAQRWAARELAYKMLSQVSFEGMVNRKDIGQ
jgi:phosphoribosylamine--glycine ligase